MSEPAATEALRIARSITVSYASGGTSSGSAFFVADGALVTCAHCVVNDTGEIASRVRVTAPSGSEYDASVESYDTGCDLAWLSSDEETQAPALSLELPPVGRQVIFSGQPQGLQKLSTFPGMVSMVGEGLLPRWQIDLIQVAAMINNGNSGGPLLDFETGAVLGVVTAKYVPLLSEIDTLQQQLDGIPQFPSDVGLGNIDFSAFVNLTVRSMWQLAKVLRLVQVGTGWAVPTQNLATIGIETDARNV